MNKNETIAQLEELREHCKSMENCSESWKKDVIALDYAISILKLIKDIYFDITFINNNTVTKNIIN